MLRNEIEVHGISESDDENAQQIIFTAAAQAGITLQDSDIDIVHRIGPKRNKIQNKENSLPRPLLVRFTRRVVRNQFLKKVKARRITTKDINIEGPPKNIYLNERLTQVNRLLFRECRAKFKQAGYKYCWTNGGNIFVKKREGNGSDSETIHVKSAHPGERRPYPSVTSTFWKIRA